MLTLASTLWVVQAVAVWCSDAYFEGWETCRGTIEFHRTIWEQPEDWIHIPKWQLPDIWTELPPCEKWRKQYVNPIIFECSGYPKPRSTKEPKP